MFKKRGSTKIYTGFWGKHLSLIATTTLIGTIIGAGMLGIPYVVSQVGFLYGFFLILFLGLAFLWMNLFLAEIVLRTKGQFQLTGYAEKYLGKWGKRVMAFSMLFSIYGALTAYLIGEGATFHSLFKVGTPLLFSLLFFLIAFVIIYKGIKATGKAEFFLISLLLLVVIIIGFFSFKQINPSYLRGFDSFYLFLPYGVILFAFLGAPSIPEIQEILGVQKRKMKKAIIIGSIIPIVIYLLFTLIVVGIVGKDNFSLLAPNERIATIALSVYAHPLLSLFANLLAILAMFTSFLTLGVALVELYEYDYQINRKLALFLAFSLPLLILLFNLTSFIAIIGITGAIAGGIEGIIIVLMYWKARLNGNRKPEFQLGPHKILGTLFLIMFGFGILYLIAANLNLI